MSIITYIRDATVQKVVIESKYKHYIADKITKVAEPGETYIKIGLLWNKKRVATERLYTIDDHWEWAEEKEILTQQQVIDGYGVDPENIESDLEYTITIYYPCEYIIKTFDDMISAMDWVKKVCPDFKNLTEIKSEL